jgi:hypothetical protein
MVDIISFFRTSKYPVMLMKRPPKPNIEKNKTSTKFSDRKLKSALNMPTVMGKHATSIRV